MIRRRAVTHVLGAFRFHGLSNGYVNWGSWKRDLKGRICLRLQVETVASSRRGLWGRPDKKFNKVSKSHFRLNFQEPCTQYSIVDPLLTSQLINVLTVIEWHWWTTPRQMRTRGLKLKLNNLWKLSSARERFLISRLRIRTRERNRKIVKLHQRICIGRWNEMEKTRRRDYITVCFLSRRRRSWRN